VKGACPEALSLLAEMLRYEASQRPNVTQCLNHPYFSAYQSEVLADEVVQQQPKMGNT